MAEFEAAELKTASDIVERIMSAHWDMAACPCWVCVRGRELGLHPRGTLLSHVNGNRRKYPVPASGWEPKQNSEGRDG